MLAFSASFSARSPGSAKPHPPVARASYRHAMPDLVYGTAAIERARTAVAGEARRLPAAADALTAPAGAAFGGLAAAADLTAALAEVTAALHADLAAGSARLDRTDRALDATLDAMHGTDAAGARSLRAG